MSDEITSVQKWRMEIASKVDVTHDKVETLTTSIKDLNATIMGYNENTEERFLNAQALASAANRRGWIAVGLSFSVMTIVLIAHFGLTMGGVVSGLGGIAGTIASIKKVI